ncbi:hypothetical protein [Floridanema evergladense]|uniref:Uncharacterized protein n=1 Tax=Floridaenema evergladense BLCC-F167 TaxID=3153639 RepID=A0ABV4WR40_9CYAN
MNTDKLSLLGCSSLALILLSSNAAIAGEINLQPAKSVDSTIAQSNLQQLTVENNDRRSSIMRSIVGCTCPSCQSRVERMTNSPNIF